ncbi:MAG: hypothetical protein KZQ64_07275 [gamma proteobacterium symbiont of Bathyaustriella thionipta]|nr:hypothetical protein [gamma proteobacterium symbiont of Bathyaustriella thionipta]MCU7951353.1 hypothetical protein [gamma proteobacterium symbiont of Bathyaustriella thionipta]MCU7953173.1 hypothetical protein [gamma proteobacterium symbiont of Bathyaustriella thionipta]MCU7957907.1 hypothetical protein [gamma proteobacterium symbiont of Bathyaustriella thionipta]MCU7965964.1 hypothetical protein [gamma proteobacterium symbiont of Bathyaustriella thionipta]
MNSIKKVNELYKHSSIEISDTDINGLAVNLETGHQYGLSAYFDESIHVYQIARHNQDIFECNDIIELINVTGAIVNFIEARDLHQTAA